MRHRFAEFFAERLFKSSYNQLLNLHIAKNGYSLTCPSMLKHTTYINVHLQPMERPRRQVCWLDAWNDV